MAIPILLTLPSSPPNPKLPQKPQPTSPKLPPFFTTRRFIITTSVSLLSSSIAGSQFSTVPHSFAEEPKSSFGSGIINTKSWFQFFGDGFAIRVPPDFQDMTEPEDYNAGLSLYGDRAKTKTFAARFASSDGAEVVSVVIRPTNQLKITFLEAQDISDLGTLRQAARLFVPGGATLSSAKTIKIKESEGYKTYYFYEFDKDDERFALVAAVNAGRAFIAGAAAPRPRWDDDGMKLRSAAISMTLL